MAKVEREFFPTDTIDWQPVEVAGYERGCYEKILSVDDETGSFTRLMRLDPGVRVSGTLTHDFWEEVYIIEGDLTDTAKKQTFKEGYYACRPPGMVHGPYETKSGFLGVEFRYYKPENEQKQDLVNEVNKMNAAIDSIGDLDPLETRLGFTFESK